MIFNPGIYTDLAQNTVQLDKNQELTNRFVLSGNQPLSALINFIRKVNTINIYEDLFLVIKWVSNMIIIIFTIRI